MLAVNYQWHAVMSSDALKTKPDNLDVQKPELKAMVADRAQIMAGHRRLKVLKIKRSSIIIERNNKPTSIGK